MELPSCDLARYFSITEDLHNTTLCVWMENNLVDYRELHICVTDRSANHRIKAH